MGTVSRIIWVTSEYREEQNEAEQVLLKEGRLYHARRAGLGMCDDYRRSGANELVSGWSGVHTEVDIRGRLRVTVRLQWACGCRWKRSAIRQLHYYQDGDQLRIAVTD